jgi:hypothetical protein
MNSEGRWIEAEMEEELNSQGAPSRGCATGGSRPP